MALTHGWKASVEICTRLVSRLHVMSLFRFPVRQHGISFDAGSSPT
jgi:hypothetical protein